MSYILTIFVTEQEAYKLHLAINKQTRFWGQFNKALNILKKFSILKLAIEIIQIWERLFKLIPCMLCVVIIRCDMAINTGYA